MKIAITVSDYSAALHIGADVDRKTAVLEIPNGLVPTWLRKYADDDGPSYPTRPKEFTISLSIIPNNP